MPPVTQDQQIKRYADAGLPVPTSSDSQTIYADELTAPTEKPITVQQPTPKSFDASIASSFQTLMDRFNETTQAETDQRALQDEILKSTGKLGTKSGRLQELRQEAGLPGQETALQGYINELTALTNERQAIPLQIQEDVAGRGVTASGAAPLEAGALRTNTIKTLATSASAQALQGNIALAEQHIQNAIDAEFEPEENKLTMLRQLYEFNRDDLDRIDKKKTTELGIMLNERERLIEDQKVDKKMIYDVGIKAQEYGADPATVQAIYDAESPEEAALAAGSWLRDPARDLELEQMILNMDLSVEQAAIAREQLEMDRVQMNQDIMMNDIDRQIKKVQLSQINRETELLGVEDPAEIAERTKEEAQNVRRAKDTVQIAQDKIDTIDLLMNHKGMKATVGAYSVGRTTPFTVDKTAQRAFIGGVEQLVSKQFLDALISSKEKGATFGALSDNEMNALIAAGTKIGTWRIKKDDRVVGYEVGEAEMKKELRRIRSLIVRAKGEAIDDTFTADELAIFDTMTTAGSTTDFNANDWYNN